MDCAVGLLFIYPDLLLCVMDKFYEQCESRLILENQK